MSTRATRRNQAVIVAAVTFATFWNGGCSLFNSGSSGSSAPATSPAPSSDAGATGAPTPAGAPAPMPAGSPAPTPAGSPAPSVTPPASTSAATTPPPNPPPAAATPTSFQIACSNGSNISGTYADNSSMCTALAGMLAACPSAISFYQSSCAAAAVAPAPSPSGGTTAATGGTATAFNLDCPDGSNYNGSYPDHASMCTQLFGKTTGSHCPTQAAQLYAQLCS